MEPIRKLPHHRQAGYTQQLQVTDITFWMSQSGFFLSENKLLYLYFCIVQQTQKSYDLW